MTTVRGTAAGLEWTVEDAVNLIAPATQIPATAEATRALANLWADYTVLAAAAAEDSTLANVDVTPLVNELVDGEIIRVLWSQVLEVDTTVVQSELQERYAVEAPGSIVDARQILLKWPPNATQAQRDSVRRVAERIRRRITDEGEDFATLATELSQADLEAFCVFGFPPGFAATANRPSNPQRFVSSIRGSPVTSSA